MFIDQQQKPTETLQEYIQIFSDLPLKSSTLLPHKAKDLAHITHFICNLHNQKLQCYVLGKKKTYSAQNTIILVQKKNHDPGYKINNIYNKQHENPNSNMGPYLACNGPHLIKDCEDSVCNGCKPNLDNHRPARCPRKGLPSRQQMSNSSYTNNNTRNQYYGHNYQNLQLSISTSKLDDIAELLEATKKMARFFKKSYKNNKSHHTSIDNHQCSTNNNSSIHSDKHKCKSHNTNDQVNKIIGQTCTSKNTKAEHEDVKYSHASNSPDSNLDSSSDSE